MLKSRTTILIILIGQTHLTLQKTYEQPLVWTDFISRLSFADTYESDVLRDRAVAQIKTFCDKGADRKSRWLETQEYNSLRTNLFIASCFFDLLILPVCYLVIERRRDVWLDSRCPTLVSKPRPTRCSRTLRTWWLSLFSTVRNLRWNVSFVLSLRIAK